MRFFYLVAHEQRLEAPLHQRPSTPGLGARDCLPPIDVQNNSDTSTNLVNQIPETSKSEVKSASDSDRTASLTKSLDKIANSKINTPVDRKPTVTGEKDEANKTTTTSATSSTLTATSVTTTILTTAATNVSSPTTTTTTTTATTMCNDSSKQIKSPIKIMKNPDGKYEVLKNPPAPPTDIKSPTSPEFSVVNSNGVKITLKQCSPPQNSNAKKPKVISDVLLRCGQVEKDAPLIQRLQQAQDKDKFAIQTNPVLPDKLEKQRRKVTFSVDRSPTSEKTSPTNASGTVPKTALKKPAEQQDKKQFLQGFQLTAREPSVPNDGKLMPTIRDIGVAVNAFKSLQKANAKVEESLKKDTDEIKKKSNTENAGSNANSNTIATNAIAKRNLLGMTANSRTNKTNDPNGRAFNSGVSSNNTNIASGKMDVYTFSDPPIVPAGAVKRKCPPGVPIADLKRRKSPQIAQKQEAKRQNASSYNSVNKLSRTSSAEHVVPTSKATNLGDYSGNSSRMPNAKASTSPLLPNDTRDFLVDGYGLNIPASLSITLTSPKSSGTSGQVEFKDPSDNNRGKVALGKVNPSITLNDRSVDPRVLKALKTGQIRMPATPTKAKPPAAATVATTKQTPMTADRSEIATSQQRATTFAGKRKREHELSKDILDLSGGKKSMDLHPLRIPQPVTKLNQNKTNKISRDNMQPGSVSDQGQLVTLGNHLYYRAPPGSLTPAAHRVSDFPLPPSPSRTPVYAPCLGPINRSSSDLSSVFPTLSSFYALNQAPNLQQFQMDTARLKLPPRPVAESGAISATSGSGDNPANSNISGVPGKSHLAAQCAPVKPARSSVAPLAVPINKQQHSADKSANVNANRTILGDPSSKPSAFRNNEDHSDDTLRLNVQKRFALDVESTNNRFLSRNEDAKSTSQATNDTARDTNAESKKEATNPDNSQQQQRQQQQNREAASPNIVSSTASPSPPPGNGTRSEGNTSQGDNNINSSNGDNNGTSSSPTKSIVSEATCNKSPDSPDSSSITVESSSGTSSSKTDREVSTDATKISDANPTAVGDSTASDDKNKFAVKSEASELAKQLTSVQKTLLAVFPSNEWANNPIAAEHLGNFLKSLNATIKNEGSTDESKTEKTDRKTEGSETR